MLVDAIDPTGYDGRKQKERKIAGRKSATVDRKKTPFQIKSDGNRKSLIAGGWNWRPELMRGGERPLYSGANQ